MNLDDGGGRVVVLRFKNLNLVYIQKTHTLKQEIPSVVIPCTYALKRSGKRSLLALAQTIYKEKRAART